MRKPAMIDEKRIKEELDYWRVPGMAVVVIQEGEPDQIICLGWRDMERGLPVTPDTKFCIASCSKSMTSALIACLVDEGCLDYDRPVREYVPHLRMKDEKADAQMTLRDMLCHRTGLGGHDALWPGTITREQLSRQIRYLQPCAEFREKALYSNLLYAMIGYIAEYVTGESWPQLMERYLFKPLRMSRTTCTAEQIESDRNHAEPYFVRKGQLNKVTFWNVDLAGPAASVNSTPKDMARWLSFHISGGKTAEGTQLISPEVFAQMHKPHIAYHDNAGLDEDCYPCDTYCQGWLSGKYRGHSLQKHSGKIEGYSTLQAYLPEERAGVVLMANLHSPTTPVFYSVLYTILDQILGYEDAHWENRFHVTGEPAAPAAVYEDMRIDVAAERLRENCKEKPENFSWSELIGIYENPGYGQVKVNLVSRENVNLVSRENEQLMLFYRDQNLPLNHWGGSQYWIDDVKEDIWLMKIPLEFVDDGNGNAAAVKIGYEPMVKDIVFTRKMP